VTLKNLVPEACTTRSFLHQMQISGTRNLQNTTDQSKLAILVTCMQVSCAKYSCILFGARNLCQKKKLVQESMTHAQETHASFWYKFLVHVPDSWVCVIHIKQRHSLIGDVVISATDVRYSEPSVSSYNKNKSLSATTMLHDVYK